ncbi:uncharacterized protein ATNIH1004_008041 [Aspergillus tanneri]|uniref:Terpene cyclase n=1 Tax=Aspergillus tanneri TaxID=1220188 RepID=A0A5M9MI12_9EURO|nr:uncharacterized protein ATNIH1004_008041 [Aspergillus tanneri]KAA8646608.1 hypothetical protein ATNIH1004_008041 [Aspergillus tanneri]
MTKNIQQEARGLLDLLATSIKKGLEVSSVSASIYDTAWVAMIQKPDIDGNTLPLFPECFQVLLDFQESDGSWCSSISELDGIINTAAALLALQSRLSVTHQPLRGDLELRCHKARGALLSMLREWNVDASDDRVGFEVILPAVLKLLEKHGITFDFPARMTVQTMHEQKVATLYTALRGQEQVSLVHSLEAFVGELNYDEIKHMRSAYGDMMASPSSTAAYLMHSSKWDDVAEGYLRKALSHTSATQVTGSVPNVFPTTIFEIAWTVSTLLDAGFTMDELGLERLHAVRTYLVEAIANMNGVVSFAPHCLPDPDDSAVALSTLQILGEHVDLQPMFKRFEGSDHFITFIGERNASLSANCNVLICILRHPDSHAYTGQVVKCARFLCTLYYRSQFKDKWNRCEQYPMMLLAKAFTLLLARVDQKNLDMDKFPQEIIEEKIPVILLDIMNRLFRTQGKDGSWGSTNELTSFSLLALNALTKLSWPGSIVGELHARIQRGKKYLLISENWSSGQHTWIGKVAYSLSNVSLAYCLAAMKATQHAGTIQPEYKELQFVSIHDTELDSNLQLLAELPLLVGCPQWKLDILSLQGALFIPRLDRVCQDILPLARSDRPPCFPYIPFTWIAPSDGSKVLNFDQLWDMMVCSFLGFRIDEYLDGPIAQDYENTATHIRHMVERLAGPRPSLITKEGQLESYELNQINNALSCLFRFFLHHPKVHESPRWMEQFLAEKLKQYFLKSLAHREDSFLLSSQSDNESHDKCPFINYFDWVRNTGSETIFAQVGFAFFLCLLDPPLQQPLQDAVVRYMVKDFGLHIATRVRQCNDLGSAARDKRELNLNSLDFVDFLDGVSDVKEKLRQVADYERRCMEKLLLELNENLNKPLIDALRLYADTAELYNQLYALQDLSLSQARTTSSCAYI